MEEQIEPTVPPGLAVTVEGEVGDIAPDPKKLSPKSPRERKSSRSTSRDASPLVKARKLFKVVPGGIGCSARNPSPKKELHAERFEIIEERPFHPPSPVGLGGPKPRLVRSGSATFTEARPVTRQRSLTNTSLETREILRLSASFQAIQEIRMQALNWDELVDMKLLTSGMFGDVHTAKYKGVLCIVKTLKPMRTLPEGQSSDGKAVKKLEHEHRLALSDFKKEMTMLTKLWHKNIVRVIGIGIKPKLFMVLEYMEGGSLKEALDLARKLRVSLDRSLVFHFAVDCATGMRYLHEAFPRIIHRDLKPANLLISKPLIPDVKELRGSRSGRPELKIADLGLSRILGPEKKHATERYRLTGGTGSLRYMAPEVASNQPYNEKADVYGFGIILWEMLANELPYKKVTAQNFFSEVVRKRSRPPIDPLWPLEVKQLIEDCWAPDPDKRPTFRRILQRLHYINETTDFFIDDHDNPLACGCVLS